MRQLIREFGLVGGLCLWVYVMTWVWMAKAGRSSVSHNGGCV